MVAIDGLIIFYHKNNMNLLITSKEQILAELTNIDSFLNITMSEDAAEAVQRGNDLAVYVARSGKLLADSKYWLNETMKSEVCLLYTSPRPRDRTRSRMPSSA